jgi:hypothetical protein
MVFCGFISTKIGETPFLYTNFKLKVLQNNTNRYIFVFYL